MLDRLVDTIFSPDVLPYLLIGFFAFAFGLLLIVFLIHRKNSYKRFMILESQLKEYADSNSHHFSDELELFKAALMNHFSEIGQRIQENEALTYKLHNALEELIQELREKYTNAGYTAQAEQEEES
ncbi:MAG: hypothetical protein WCR58_00675 [Bacteroidales bacterium]|jgi:hypothetical protein|nr:hypothetical protein [Bacteroidales bacterium]MDD3700122.1 hypothetical protein [Bacteroidales bacterium]MDY0369054.1 hypothetical protein [Bacteroidales bacterium]